MEYKIKVFSSHSGIIVGNKHKYRGIIRIDNGAEHVTEKLYDSQEEAIIAAFAVLKSKIPTLVNFISDIRK